MKLFKAKSPFFNGSYYKELLRELKVIGIVCAVIQLLYGFAGEFGGGNSGLLSMFTIGSPGLVHNDCFMLFFYICGINFLSTHISRKNWDFRNSLPVSKRTMFTCHFAAVLTFAAIIFAANFLGAFIGEGVRLIAKSTSVPDGYGISAVSMLKTIVTGITAYCLLVIVGSVVNNIFSVLAVVAIYIGLPILFMLNAFVVSRHGVVSGALLFPLGVKGTALASTALLLIEMLVSVAVAYIAFGKSRVETFMKPARTKWIHILIGILGAGCVGLMVSGLQAHRLDYRSYADGASVYEFTPWYVSVLVIGLIAMTLAYFVYMWITMKSFKKALASCVFAPLGFLVVAASVLTAVAADKKSEKLDFSAKNIEYVRIMDENFTKSGDYYNMLPFMGNVEYSSSFYRGSSKAFDVKITDEYVINRAAELISSHGYEFGSREQVFGVAGRFITNMGQYTRPIEVTLKDGTKWTVAGGDPRAITLKHLEDNEEYIEKLASLDRFKNGRVISPFGLGSELDKTLLEELASLSAADRAAILTGGRIQRASRDEQSDLKGIENLEIRLTLASPSYDQVATIRLNEKLPKTIKLYMKLMTERMKAHKDFSELISRLEAADFGRINTTVMDLETGIFSSAYIYRGEPFFKNGAFDPKVKEFCALVAECLKADQPMEGAEHRMGITFDGFVLSEQRASGAYSDRSLFGGESVTAFIGVSSENARKLNELCREIGNIEKDFFGANDDFQKEAQFVAEAVEAGRLKLYDSFENELTAENIMDMYYNGYEYFYAEDGIQKHITEFFEEAIKMDSENP